MNKLAHLVVFAGLALCFNSWMPVTLAQESSLESGASAGSDLGSFPNFSKERRSEIVTAVETLLQTADGEEDVDFLMMILGKAHAKLAPLLIDPNQDDIDVWYTTGRMALASYDPSLGAIAFEAIDRLDPSSKSNPRLAALMTELAQLPIDDYVHDIKDQRSGFAAAMADVRLMDANEDVAPAMNHIGNSYDLGLGVAENNAEAIKWYKHAADAGSTEGMYNLALMYDNGEGVAEDNLLAAKWYEKASDAGDVDAMYNLGIMYQSGEGVDQSFDNASTWYTKAANNGSSDAMYNLAMLYDNGLNGPENNLMAIEWYTKAANLGDADSMYNLAIMYDEGEGVDEDNALAMEWYRKAAAAGDTDAMYNLAIMYEDGEGVTQSFDEAVKWYSQSASGGHVDAMYNIGVLYYNGTGLVEDKAQAIRWWTKAARLGEEASQAMLVQVGVEW